MLGRNDCTPEELEHARNADGSVLKLEIGAPIRLWANDFERLSQAVFAELEAKFVR